MKRSFIKLTYLHCLFVCIHVQISIAITVYGSVKTSRVFQS